MGQIRTKAGENGFYIIIDENIDTSGPYWEHISVLEEDNSSKRSLFGSTQNNLTVTRFVQE